MKTLSNRIAIIEPIGGHGGMNYYDFSLANALCSIGIAVTIYTCDETNTHGNFSFKIIKSFKGIWGRKPKIYRAMRYFEGLLYSLIHAKFRRIKLIHFHFFNYTFIELLSISFAKFFGFKVVVTVHDVESFDGVNDIKAAKQILKIADNLISHNYITKREMIEKFTIDSKKISIIAHGNYLSNIPYKIKPQDACKRLKIPHDCQVILFFGQIKKVKGLDILLNALPEIKNHFPRLKLIIAGKVWKDDFEQYKNIIRDNHLMDNIDLHTRYIKDEEVPIFYNSADVVILPYRKIYQSGVLLMAMSYKKPVIVSNLDGMLEIINDGKNGIVFESENPKKLSEKIIFALQNPLKLNNIANSGYETVLCNHDWDKIGHETSNVYRKILQ
jgi:D-inositol-3-phosphate glycosyltransferase